MDVLQDQQKSQGRYQGTSWSMWWGKSGPLSMGLLTDRTACRESTEKWWEVRWFTRYNVVRSWSGDWTGLDCREYQISIGHVPYCWTRGKSILQVSIPSWLDRLHPVYYPSYSTSSSKLHEPIKHSKTKSTASAVLPQSNSNNCRNSNTSMLRWRKL